MRRLGFVFVCVGSLISSFALPRDFVGSERILPVLREHLDKAEAAMWSGEFDRCEAYTNSVLLNRFKVYVDLDGVKGCRKRDAQKAWEAGLAMWDEAIPGILEITPAASREDADLVVEFGPRVTTDGQAVYGHFDWMRWVGQDLDGKYQSKLKATIRIRTELPGGGKMPTSYLKHICGHEIGHVLGLDDGLRVGTLMGPGDIGVCAKPNASEIEAVESLRSEAVKVRELALGTRNESALTWMIRNRRKV